MFFFSIPIYLIIDLHCIVCVCVSIPTDTPTKDFHHHVQLDSNYQLHWMFNETHIMFETVVNTTGYIGFGISGSANSYPADVAVVGVAHGKPYIYDGHTLGHYPPVLDKHQDWFLISAAEANGVTTVRFWRKLTTCDDEDRPILDGTTRVLFSYHADDIKPEEVHQRMMYHGSKRGSRSLLLINPPNSESQVKPLPHTIKTLDFLNANFSVPKRDTYYNCISFALPDLGGKHHMIRFEPVVQKGHEKLVHHIFLRYCESQVDPSLSGKRFHCYHVRFPELRNCHSVLIAWDIGGLGFDFPSHVGYPLGTDADPKFFVMETHYDNAAMRGDIVDNSGLRITLTSELRPNDAGTLELGSDVNNHMVIPPYSKAFLNSGYCSQDCLAEGLGDQEMHLFATRLHSHLIGRALRVRIVRDRQELAPLVEDNNWNFNFQEMRKLRKEVVVRKGDSFIMECLYKSTHKNVTTFGGLSTRDEMCLAYAMYYPRIPLTRCRSYVKYHDHGNIHHWVDSFDWTKQSSHDEFKRITSTTNVGIKCMGSKKFASDHKVHTQSSLQPTSRYQPPSGCH